MADPLLRQPGMPTEPADADVLAEIHALWDSIWSADPLTSLWEPQEGPNEGSQQGPAAPNGAVPVGWSG